MKYLKILIITMISFACINSKNQKTKSPSSPLKMVKELFTKKSSSQSKVLTLNDIDNALTTIDKELIKRRDDSAELAQYYGINSQDYINNEKEIANLQKQQIALRQQRKSLTPSEKIEPTATTPSRAKSTQPTEEKPTTKAEPITSDTKSPAQTQPVPEDEDEEDEFKDVLTPEQMAQTKQATKDAAYAGFQKIMRQIQNLPTQLNPTIASTGEKIPSDSMGLPIGIVKSATSPRLGYLIATIIGYSQVRDHIVEYGRTATTGDHIKNFRGILSKNPAEYTPFEQTLKSCTDMVHSLLNIMDSATDEQKEPILSMLSDTGALADIQEAFANSQQREYDETNFHNISFANPASDAKSTFIQSIEKALKSEPAENAEKKAVEIFKAQLKPEVLKKLLVAPDKEYLFRDHPEALERQNYNMVRAMFQEWNTERENNKNNPAARDYTDTIAFIIKNSKVLKKIFSETPTKVNPTSKPSEEFIKKSKKANPGISAEAIAKAWKQEEISKAESQERLKKVQAALPDISADTITKLWENIDFYQGLVSKTLTPIRKITNFCYKATNFFRIITFRKPRPFTENIYEDRYDENGKKVSASDQITTDIKNSLLPQLTKGAVLLGKAWLTIKGKKVEYALRYQKIKEGAQEKYRLMVETAQGTWETLKEAPGAVTNFVADKAWQVTNAVTSPVKGAVGYLRDVFDSIRGIGKDITAADLFDTKEGEKANPDDLAAQLQDYMTGDLTEMKTFVKNIFTFCKEAAESDTKTYDLESSKRMLIEQLVLQELTKNLKEFNKDETKDRDEEEYFKELQDKVNERVAAITQQLDTQVEQAEQERGWFNKLTKKFRQMPDNELLDLFKEQLEQSKAALANDLQAEFTELNKQTVPFADAQEPALARTISLKQTEDTLDTSDAEKTAYNRLFEPAAPEATAKTPYQQALEGCDEQMKTLFSFVIESSNLQSEGYRQELLQTGVADFYKGLDTPNHVTRLVHGAASINNILKYVEGHNSKDLKAFIKTARVMTVLAHDTLIEDFFSTHCTSRLTGEQRKSIIDVMNDPKNTAQQRSDFLKPFLNTGDQANADALSNILQNHITLPARTETSLVYLQNKSKISAFLKKQTPSNKEIEDFCKKMKIEPKALGEMLEYQKSLDFMNTRKVISTKTMSYKIKNFFQVLLPKSKVKDYGATEYQDGQEFVTSVENSPVKGLGASDNHNIQTLYDLQYADTETLLDLIKKNQSPEKTASTKSPSETSTPMEGVLAIGNDIVANDPSTDIVPTFMKALGVVALDSNNPDQSLLKTQQAIIDYISGNKTTMELPIAVIAASAPAKLQAGEDLPQKVLCGLKAIKYIQDNKEAFATTKIEPEDFAALVKKINDAIMAKQPKTLFGKPKPFTSNKEQPALEQFKDALNKLSPEELRAMLTEALGAPTKPLVFETPITSVTDPLNGLELNPLLHDIPTPIKTPPSDNSNKNNDEDEFHDSLETSEEIEAQKAREAAEELKQEQEKEHQRKLTHQKREQEAEQLAEAARLRLKFYGTAEEPQARE